MKKTILVIFLCLLLISFVSALTEEERIRNNQFIERGELPKPESVGIIGEKNQGVFSLNPFVVFGVIFLFLLIIYLIVKSRAERERI